MRVNRLCVQPVVGGGAVNGNSSDLTGVTGRHRAALAEDNNFKEETPRRANASARSSSKRWLSPMSGRIYFFINEPISVK